MTQHIIDTDELEKLLSAVTIDTFAGEPYVTGLTEIYALIANSPQADGIVLAPSEYRLDYSTGTPILMHKDCSVIEGNEAVAIFGLLSAYKPQADANTPPDVYDIVVDTGDGIYHTTEVVHFQQRGSKRMIQVRIGEPKADDVRKDSERWRYLKDKYAMVNFDIYDAEMGETKVTGIIFEMPSGIRYSADINATIDQAIDKARE